MSVERAKEALLNAHRAGDVESARKLANYIKSQESQQVPQPMPDQGFSPIADIERQLGERGSEIGRLGEMREAGDITFPEQAFRTAGQVAGGIGDVGGVALRTGLQGLDYLTGDRVSEYGGQALEAIGDIPIGERTLGERLGSGVRAIGEEYGEFKEDFPRAAGLLEAGGNLATVIPGFAKYAEDIFQGVKGAQRAPKPEIAPSQAVRAQGSKLFQLAEEQGGNLKPEFVENYVQRISAKVQRDPAIKSIQAITGKTDPYAQINDALKDFADRPMTLETAKTLDETLGDLAYSNVEVASPSGALNDVGRKYLDMQMTFRNMVDNADPSSFQSGRQGFDTIKKARKLWKTSLKLADVERIIERASSFKQPSTAIQTGFRTLLNNTKKMRGVNNRH